MAFDGIVTRAMARELNDALGDSRIDKIHQPDNQELLLTIRTRTGQEKLFISIAAGRAEIHLASNEKFENPKTPPPFCMLMRKLLTGAHIEKISQVDWERIIKIDLIIKDEMGFPENVSMYVELMGRHSNIILVSAEGNIMAAIKNVSEEQSRVRPISAGMQYSLPPTQNKIAPDDVTAEIIHSLVSPKQILSKIQGISPIIADEIIASPNKTKYLESLIKSAEDPSPSVYIREDGHVFEFHVKELEYHGGLKRKTFTTLSEAVNFFFESRISTNRRKQKTAVLENALNGSLKKLHLKLQKLHEDLAATKKAENYQLYGELITANIHNLKQGMDLATLTNYYDGSEVEIKLDPNLAPNQNAQKYFKKYAKSKIAKVEKQEQINLTREEISYLEGVASFLANAETVEEVDSIKSELKQGGYLHNKQKLSKKKSKQTVKEHFSPKKYETSNGFSVWVGRNNKENDKLTMKRASKTDLWFHTKDIPGSHVILFTENKKPEQSDLTEAAQIAAYHSAARESENVPVDMVLVKHVKKPNRAKPGMVIFTNNQTFYVTPKIPE